MQKIQEAKEKFFENCEIVVRAPGLFFWTGEHSVEYGHPALMQPINLWLYVGIHRSINPKCTVEIKHVKPTAPIFDPLKLDPDEHFLDDPQMPGLNKSRDSIVRELQRWRDEFRPRKGIALKVWTDVPFAVGLNASGALSICMSIIYYFLKTRLEKRKLNEILMELMYMKPSLLLRDKRFLEIFAKARWCDSLVSSHYKSGAAPFAAFLKPMNGKDLILYLTERRGYGTKKPIQRIKTENPEEHRKYIEGIKYWGTRIDTPALLADGTYGVSLVCCGTIDNPSSVERDMYTWHRQSKDRLRTLLKNESLIKAIPKSSLALPVSDILSGSKGVENSSFPRYIYNCTLGMIGWRLIDILLSDKNEAEDFKNLIIENHKLLKAYGVLRGPLREFKREIRQMIGDKLFAQLMMKMTGPGNGGDLLIVGEWHDIDKVNEKVKKLEVKKDYVGPQLHYTSADKNWGIPADENPICDFARKADVSGGTIHLIVSNRTGIHIQLVYNGGQVEFVPKNQIHQNFLKLLIDHRFEQDFCPAWLIYTECFEGLDDEARKTLYLNGHNQPENALDNAEEWAREKVRLLANNLRRNKIPQSKVFLAAKNTSIDGSANSALTSGWRLAGGVKVIKDK